MMSFREEVKLVGNLLAEYDSMHFLTDSEVEWIHNQAADGKRMNEVREAANHVLVTKMLPQLVKDKTPVIESLVLQLHSLLMAGLLKKTEEGGPGNVCWTGI